MNETKACQHCYARIIQVGHEWVDAEFPTPFCAGTMINHKPMPDIRKEEHAN
jgi:hypothetical protein